MRRKKRQAAQTLHLNMTDTNAAQEPSGNGSNGVDKYALDTGKCKDPEIKLCSAAGKCALLIGTTYRSLSRLFNPP